MIIDESSKCRTLRTIVVIQASVMVVLFVAMRSSAQRAATQGYDQKEWSEVLLHDAKNNLDLAIKRSKGGELEKIILAGNNGGIFEFQPKGPFGAPFARYIGPNRPKIDDLVAWDDCDADGVFDVRVVTAKNDLLKKASRGGQIFIDGVWNDAVRIDDNLNIYRIADKQYKFDLGSHRWKLDSQSGAPTTMSR